VAETEIRPTSRNIPAPVQRKVRQRCGFGCVICGLPLYEYDHLLGWATVHRHVADEITLLCDRHHREKTSGLLPNEDVVEANRTPFNIQQGISTPYGLHFRGSYCEILLGAAKFEADLSRMPFFAPIVIDELAIIAFRMENGNLFLSLNVFDECNMLVLAIESNQLVYSTSQWDVEFVGKNLILREATRKILIDIVFDVPNKIQIARARLLRNGVELNVSPGRVVVVNNAITLQGPTVRNCPIGILIGPTDGPVGAAIRIEGVNRYCYNSAVAAEWLKQAFPPEGAA
jgi:hypothetical protein